MGKSKISWAPRPSEHNSCRVGQSGSGVMGQWDRVARRPIRQRERAVRKRGSERGKRKSGTQERFRARQEKATYVTEHVVTVTCNSNPATRTDVMIRSIIFRGVTSQKGHILELT